MGTNRILIIGAGLTGLALASGLRTRGIEPVLVERAPTITTEIGWAIVLWPTHLAALDRIGHADRSGWPFDRQGTILWWDHQGNLLRLANAGYGLVAIGRAELQLALLDPVRDLVRTGVTPVALVDHGDRVEVDFNDGTHGSFDAVIGADGLNSWTRRHVLHGPGATHADCAVIRFQIPNTDNLTVVNFAHADDVSLGCFILNAGKTLHAAVILHGEKDNRRELTLAELATLFSTVEGPARTIVTAMQSNPLHYYNNINQVIVDQWVNNRIGLIGDAAHAMSPVRGQGAGVGFEDAALLAELLALPHTPAPLALRNYERIRKPLAQAIQAESHAATIDLQRPPPPP
jgi:2-polyprenyl-6-methoxyphenol hydroxylase-like FAD-dependent oxidoreductase